MHIFWLVNAKTTCQRTLAISAGLHCIKSMQLTIKHGVLSRVSIRITKGLLLIDYLVYLGQNVYT
jgi:hypothetical protein